MAWLLAKLKSLGGEHHRDHDEQLHLFYLVFVIQLAVQYGVTILHRGQRFDLANARDLSSAIAIIGHILVLGWLFQRRMTVVTAFLLTLLAGWALSASYPAAALHEYLVLYIAMIFLLVRDDGAERSLAFGSLRWLCAMGWIWFGVQKALNGFYFDGQYIAHQISTEPTTRLLLGKLVDARSLAQLSAATEGPFNGHGLLLNITSNAIWLGEIAIGIALLAWRTRLTALIVGSIYLLVSAITYREPFNSLLLFNMILLFAPPALHRSGAAFIIFFCAWILAGAVGVVPALAGVG